MVLSKEEAKVQFKAYLQELASVSATPEGKSLSEAMTRFHFIDKYVDCLGYQGITDLELEHPVKNTGKFIDYVLKVAGEPVLAVEAKALSVPLSDSIGAQLLEYQVVENIEWGIATNARELWVYYLYLQGPPRDKCVMKLDLLPDDLDAKVDAIFDRFWLLSKESMSTGVGLRSLIKESQLEKAIEGAVLDRHSRVVQALRTDVRDRTGRRIRVTADEVVSWLRNRLARGLAPTAPAPGAPQEGPVASPPEPRRFTSFLKQMIERGIIPANAELTGRHAGGEHTALLDSEGYVVLNGDRFRRPSGAAKRITGSQTNGWEFWKYQGVPLAKLREKLWQN